MLYPTDHQRKKNNNGITCTVRIGRQRMQIDTDSDFFSCVSVWWIRRWIHTGGHVGISTNDTRLRPNPFWGLCQLFGAIVQLTTVYDAKFKKNYPPGDNQQLVLGCVLLWFFFLLLSAIDAARPTVPGWYAAAFWFALTSHVHFGQVAVLRRLKAKLETNFSVVIN